MKEQKNTPQENQKMEEMNQKKSQDESVSGQASTNEPVTLTGQEYEALLKKVKELQTLEDRMLRSAADFENAKKRLVKDREEFSRFVLESFFYELLPILDNFERALSHQADLKTPPEKSVWSGVQLIYKQLSEIIKLRGLVRMDVLEKPFDPHFHEAIAQVQSDAKDGMVAEEVIPGYLFQGKVLRPAKVKVYTKQKLEDIEKIEEIT